MDAARSKLRPSLAHVWMKCPGFVSMPHVDIDETEPEAAANGTAAHELGAIMLDALLVRHAPASFLTLDKYEGQTATNGVVWDRDHFTSARAYALDVLTQIANLSQDGQPYYFGIEETVHIPETGQPGQTDFWAYFPSPDVLLVVDFKNGFRFVNEYYNWQGVCYISGVQKMLVGRGLRRANFDGMKLQFRIFQPNCFVTDRPAGRSWVFDEKLFAGMKAEIEDAAYAAGDPNAPLKSGTHCGQCGVRHLCPAAADAAGAALDTVGNMRTDVPDGPALAFRLREVGRILNLVKSYHGALEAHAVAIIKDGGRVPGYVYKSGSAGRRVWNDDDDVSRALFDGVAALRVLNGEPSLHKPPEPVTPRQAEIAGLPPQIVAAMSRHAPGKPRLLLETQQDLERIFGNVR